MTVEQSVQAAYRAIDEKSGEDIKVLKISGISALTDYFIISSASTERQIGAISENIQQELAKEDVFLRSKEGENTSSWILLDYGDFIIHLFKSEERQFYNLERLWKDAPLVEVSEL